MAKTDFTITSFKLTSTSATTAYHDISQYIDELSGMELAAEVAESHALGDNYVENTFTGLRRVSNITIAGFYDDVAASGPHALLGNATDIGAERVIKVNFGTTNAYPKQRVIVLRYARRPTRGQLTRFEAEFVPSASYVVATT